MSEEKSDRSASFLSSPSTWLALLTMLGGVWLVSQKLTSSRPAAAAEAAQGSIGEQALEARLWEDPFRPLAEVDQSATLDYAGSASELQIGLRRRIAEAPPGEDVLLLPVMVSGGHYSEDTESRVRSRFAVVSALGESDYVPEDAEHVGVAWLPWPSTVELTTRSTTGAKRCACADTEHSPGPLVSAHREHSEHLAVPYEWYRNKTFGQARQPAPPRGHDTTGVKPDPAQRRHASILVLWLDDAMFEDDPRLRLALLLERLLNRQSDAEGPVARVALIGPRRSSSLRALLPPWGSTIPERPSIDDAPIRHVLSNVDLYCATPSTSDDLLVKGAGANDQAPRASVAAALAAHGGFGSFRHFTATDAQLASEVLAELQLRQARLTRQPKHPDWQGHLVLISEWDTFYGRMLALTYEAQLRALRDPALSPGEYVEARVLRESAKRAANFHSFVYLRGVDGQTVSRNSEPSESEARPRGQARPSTWEQVRDWTPDINRAEGPAQFDYLGRLGDRIAALQRYLDQAHAGQVTAIGIVGSDVYDTLLILQALRPRFPAAHFFTTDLDVRFLHPRERAWARNLLVISSYGLTLHRSLQGTVAPFRDSMQTAQFAAVLAALGDHRLAALNAIPPRRFEIGNGVAVDLSRKTEAGQPVLHPRTPTEDRGIRSAAAMRKVIPVGAILAVVLLLLSRCWPALRNLAWDARRHLTSALEYTEEDTGAPECVALLVRRLLLYVEDNPSDTLARDLLRDLRWGIENAQPPHVVVHGYAEILLNDVRHTLLGPERQADLVAPFVTALNNVLKDQVHGVNQPASSPDSKLTLARVRRELRSAPSVRKRIDLDVLLNRLGGTPRRPVPLRRWMSSVVYRKIRIRFSFAKVGARWWQWVLHALLPATPTVEPKLADAGTALLFTAANARDAAWVIFGVRLGNLLCWWSGVVAFAVLASIYGYHAWQETYLVDSGEPFSLWSGISAWPAAIVRLLVTCLAAGCIVSLWTHLRGAFYSITRGFRFAGAIDGYLIPSGKVCVETMWCQYHRTTGFFRRVGRSFVIFALYLVVGCAIFAFSPHLFMPWRGTTVAICDLLASLCASLGVVFLACLTIDASLQCRRFITKLSHHPTVYPVAATQFFRRQLGNIEVDYMEEWLDLQLIAELTEKVGRLVYWPTWLVLLLIISRAGGWDRCSWNLAIVLTVLLNFALALASVVLLQRSAKQAKARAEASLGEKLKRLRSQTVIDQARINIDRGTELLEEIRTLKRGAFVPFWENPVVSAVFLSSGGTTLVQGLVWFLAR